MIHFIAQWAATAIALWASSYIFSGIRFETMSALAISALLLGFANAIVKPVLVVLTLPLTIFSFGLFLLVINALVLMLTASLVRGFEVSDFGTAFFASIFISLISIFINTALVGDIVIRKF
jgi:putative membrane protein